MIETKKPLLLSAEERRTPMWFRIMEHMKERLEYLRVQNEGDKSEVQTAKIRGQIAELKAIMALDTPNI